MHRKVQQKSPYFAICTSVYKKKTKKEETEKSYNRLLEQAVKHETYFCWSLQNHIGL